MLSLRVRVQNLGCLRFRVFRVYGLGFRIPRNGDFKGYVGGWRDM